MENKSTEDVGTLTRFSLSISPQEVETAIPEDCTPELP
jgi:hypothetical protein